MSVINMKTKKKNSQTASYKLRYINTAHWKDRFENMKKLISEQTKERKFQTDVQKYKHTKLQNYEQTKKLNANHLLYMSFSFFR